jgi:glycosyltransferase involved in cell wall biosynthesis
VTGDPHVSVVLAVHNGARHLRAAVDSVLGQSLADLELIVIDDESTDATGDILASYGDTRMIVVRQDRRGQTRSLNRGIELARAPYIARQDADDISFPERLEKQVAFLDRHAGIDVLGTAVTVIDDTGRKLRDYVYPTCHEGLSARLMRLENPLPHTTLMFRAAVVRELGGYETVFRKAQDFDLLLRVIEQHRVASLAEPLCQLRLSMDSATFDGDAGEQLRWALLAYLRAKVRREEGEDLVRAAAWPRILAEYEAWFASSPYQRFFSAARKRRRARIASGTGRYLEGALALWSALLDDPRWLMRKVGLIRHETLARDGVRWLTENLAGCRSHVRDSGPPRD